MRFGLAGWSRASRLVKLGCVWAGPYMCGPESRVHAGRGSLDTRVARYVGLGV